MNPGTRLRLAAAAAGAAEGLVFWVATEYGPDAGSGRAILMALMVLTGWLALVVQLVWRPGLERPLAAPAMAAGLVLAASAWWVWDQMPAVGEAFAGDRERAGTWGVALVLIGVIALAYLKTWVEARAEGAAHPFPYEGLVRHSWTHVASAAFAWVFIGMFAATLALWAGLFEMLDIDFFGELFTEEAFMFIVGLGVTGLGLAIARENEKIIGAQRRAVTGLARALLPLIALVAVLFALTLPVAGIGDLWSTRSASAILLGAVLLVGLLFNFVFNDGDSPWLYPRPVQLLVSAAIVLMSVFSLLALYSTSLRIDQYGLTPARVWAVIFGITGMLYGVPYGIAVIRGRGGWYPAFEAINRTVAPVLAILAVLLHSPVLDPIGLSARDQYGRLVSGTVTVDEFDWATVRFRLGRAGDQVLTDIERRGDSLALAAAPHIERVREAASFGEVRFVADQAVELPGDFADADSVTALVARDPSFQAICAGRGPDSRPCRGTLVDLDSDGSMEVVVGAPSNCWQLAVVARTDAGWRRVGTFSTAGQCVAVSEALSSGAFARIQNRYPSIEINGDTLRFTP